MRLRSLGLLFFLSACHLPPPTTASVAAVNARSSVEYPALPAATEAIEPRMLADYALKPVCDVRGGTLAHDEKALAKVLAGIGKWQTLQKKAPPKHVAENPNQGPVSVSNGNVQLKIPGASSGKPATDLDPAWFAVACEGNKITATLDDEPIELDALFMSEQATSPELALAGFSLKTKGVLFAKLNTSPRPPHAVPNTSFLVYDLSRYLTAGVAEVDVLHGEEGFSLFFLEDGHKAGVRVLGRRYGRDVEVGRFTVGAPPAG